MGSSVWFEGSVEVLFHHARRAPPVRRRKADLHARVNGDLTLRFTGRGLTSFGGLELFRRFLQGLKFSARLRHHLRRCDPSADFSSVTLIRLLLAMMVVGARRLGHVRHLVGDPVIQRFCGLAAWPSDRTVSRWLSRCTAQMRSALQAFNAELVALAVRPLQLGRLTIDVDGTVVCTGLQVERAFRGYNPHHRKDKSYYPITAHLAQTGHLLRVQNRSGNVHDGKAGLPFLRDLLVQTRQQFGRIMTEMRLDGAFFRAEVLAWLERRTRYAVKGPFYQWIGLKSLIQQRRRWKRGASDVDGFDTTLWLAPGPRCRGRPPFRQRVSPACPQHY